MWRKKKTLNNQACVVDQKKFNAYSEQQRNSLRDIFQLTAVTRIDFDRYFQPLINGVCDHLVSIHRVDAGNKADNAVSDWLRHLERAMRIRQSQLLPPAAPSELVAQSEDIYSYAVILVMSLEVLDKNFTSQLSEQLPSQSTIYEADTHSSNKHLSVCAPATHLTGFGLLSLKNLVGQGGWSWLCKHPIVLSDVVKYFTAPNDSALSLIFLSLYDNYKTSNQSRKRSKKWEAVSANTPPKHDVKGRPRAKGWDFVDDLRRAVVEGQLSINHKESSLYFDEVGNFLIVEDSAFKWFSEQSDCAENTARSRFRRLGIVELTRKKKDRFFALFPNGDKEVVMMVSSENAARYFGLRALESTSIKVLR